MKFNLKHLKEISLWCLVRVRKKGSYVCTLNQPGGISGSLDNTVSM